MRLNCTTASPISVHQLTCPAVFGTVHHDLHRKRRASFDSLFSKKAVYSFEPVLQGMVDRLSEIFLSASLQNQPVELGSSFLALTTDAVCEHVLGSHCAFLDSSERTLAWKKTIRAIACLTPFAKQFPWIMPTAFRLPLYLLQRIAPSLSRIVELQFVRHQTACSYQAKA
jgi:cytochrome P450